MKRFTILALLVGLALSAPTSKESKESNEDGTLVITKEFFPGALSVYTAEHDIVDILMPLNDINFSDDEDDDVENDEDDFKSTIFIVEADDNNGVREYKGLSVIKNKQYKKILETGTSAAAGRDYTKTAYFAATDGLYSYNEKKNTAEKYGSITDSLIGIAKANGSDLIYILTANNEVYKVTEEGNKKVKVDDVVGAKQIVLDYSNNLYYYGADKEPCVVSADGTKKIEGLPKNPTYINLLKPPFVIHNGVPVIIDNKSYIIYANGTSEITDFEFQVKPTAYAPEATLIQYYAYDKKIYEYNILSTILGELMSELQSFLDTNVNKIQEIATRSRSNLKA